MRFWILIGILVSFGSGLRVPLMGQSVSSQLLLTEEAQRQATIDRARVDLDSGSPELRKGAVMLLSKYESAQARGAVLGALRDPDPTVRFAAVVSALAWRSYTVAALEELIHALDDPEVDIRRAVSTSLDKLVSYRLRASQQQQLQQLLLRPNRVSGGQMPMPPTLPVSIQRKMVNALLDTDVVVRRNMISKYNALRINAPSEIFVRLLQDEDLEVRSSVLPLAARYLEFSLFLEKTAVVVDDESPILRLSLIRELNPRGEVKPIQLLQKLSLDADPEVATAAQLQLYNNDPNLVRYQLLVKRFAEGSLNAKQRERLVQLLGQLEEVEERNRFVLQFLEVSEEVLRVVAARHFFNLELGELYPENLALILKMQSVDWEVWLESEFKDVRLALVRLASALPREESAEVLFDLLLDDEIDVRVGAMTMYSRMRMDGFEKVLEKTLQDESVIMQKRAVQYIIQQMGPSGRALLERHLKDEDDRSPLSVYIKTQLKAPK
jgi:HEAT repeat protein